MELSWSTFLLEILNFLVLVWILSRFLYTPVLDAISRRKADIDRTLADSQNVREQAQGLLQQYESRLAVWEAEKQKAREELAAEITRERARLLEELRLSIEQEREKARVVDERHGREQRRQVEEAAFAQGGAFVARLLSRLSSPELEARLLALVVEDLQRLSEEQRRALLPAAPATDVPVKITSAFPLTEPQRDTLTRALKKVAYRDIHCEWTQDEALIAGLRIRIGPWLLGANLRDELRFFTELLRREHPRDA